MRVPGVEAARVAQVVRAVATVESTSAEALAMAFELSRPDAATVMQALVADGLLAFEPLEPRDLDNAVIERDE